MSFVRARQQFGIGDGERGLKCSIGTYKNGVLYVPDPTKEARKGTQPEKGRGGRGGGAARRQGKGKGRGKGRGRGKS